MKDIKISLDRTRLITSTFEMKLDTETLTKIYDEAVSELIPSFSQFLDNIQDENRLLAMLMNPETPFERKIVAGINDKLLDCWLGDEYGYDYSEEYNIDVPDGDVRIRMLEQYLERKDGHR